MTARDVTGFDSPAMFLRQYGRVYNLALGELRRVLASGDVPTSLALIQLIATFAATHHPGRFADGALENPLLGFASLVPDLPATALRGRARPPAGRRHVLHIATSVRSLGGHTRTITNWILHDRGAYHVLVLTDQGELPVPEPVRAGLAAAGGEIISLPAANALTRAAWLRSLALQVNGVIISHQTPDDIVPGLALACSLPSPVGYLNAADHTFWLGGTVADTVIGVREVARPVTLTRRFPEHDILLPIPLLPPALLSKHEARRALGLADDQVVLVTVGRAHKYQPTSVHNFFRAASRILECHPSATILMVGVSPEDYADRPECDVHRRLRMVGPDDDPSPYLSAADVYLEGFPFGSQTACLEGLIHGLPPVLAHSLETGILGTGDWSLRGLVDHPASEDEYVAQACALIANPQHRTSLGRGVQARAKAFHTGDGWMEHLDAFYAHMDALTHRPHPLPEAPFRQTADDVGVAGWHAAAYRTEAPTAATNALQNLLMARAYTCRKEHELVTALRLVQLASRRYGWNRNRVMEVLKVCVTACIPAVGKKRRGAACAAS